MTQLGGRSATPKNRRSPDPGPRAGPVPCATIRCSRWITLGAFGLTFLLAGEGPGGRSEVHAGHNTCALVTQAGGEATVEGWALGALNGKLPKSFSDKVTVGHVPITNDPIKVDVDATVKKPAKNVNIVCGSSSLSSKLDIKVRVSGKAGSSTHEGEGRITGHYTVVAGSPIKICVSNINMASLNLQGVQNDVDNWIRKKINNSSIVGNFCVP